MRIRFSLQSAATGVKLASIIVLPLFLFGCGTKTAPDGGVLRSDDSGETWAQKVVGDVSNAITPARIDTVVVKSFINHPMDESTIYALATDGVYRTRNDAEIWEKITPGVNAISLVIDPFDVTTHYLSIGNQIIKTSNEGTDWEIVYQDSEGRQISKLLIDPISSNTLIAFLTTKRILVTHNQGESWSTLAELPTDSYVRDAELLGGSLDEIIAITNNQHILRTKDRGSSWEDLTASVQKKIEKLSDLADLQVSSDGTVWMGSNQTLLHSSDQGSTWSVFPTLLSSNQTVGVYAVDLANPDVLYLVNGQTIHRTTNAGSTWVTLEHFGSSRPISSLLIRRNSGSEILFAGTSAPPEKKNPYFPFLN